MPSSSIPTAGSRRPAALIWRDASGWNYGKFDDPDHPRYNFAREVDYCSGACVMVPRALCSSSAAASTRIMLQPTTRTPTWPSRSARPGYKVVYQPLATIVHHEGLTSGRSTSSGVKAHQARQPGEVSSSAGAIAWPPIPLPAQAPFRIVHAARPGHGIDADGFSSSTTGCSRPTGMPARCGCSR